MKKLIAFILLFALAACSRPAISRAQWEKMTPEEKRVVVESLKGGEVEKSKKGGEPAPHPQSTDAYIAAIDDSYRRGDSRDVMEIWNQLSR